MSPSQGSIAIAVGIQVIGKVRYRNDEQTTDWQGAMSEGQTEKSLARCDIGTMGREVVGELRHRNAGQTSKWRGTRAERWAHKSLARYIRCMNDGPTSHWQGIMSGR